MASKTLDIFRPNSVKKQTTIQAPLNNQIVSVMVDRFDKSIGNVVKRNLEIMDEHGLESVQFRIGDQRVRVHQSA